MCLPLFKEKTREKRSSMIKVDKKAEISTKTQYKFYSNLPPIRKNTNEV